MRKVFYLSSVLAVLLLACRTKKQSTATSAPPAPADLPVVQLDTVHVPSVPPLILKTYRETPEKSSDILHTRLEVNFDWQNSRMNGKAYIDLKQHFYASDKIYLNARGMDIRTVKVYTLKEADPKTKTTEAPSEVKDIVFTYSNDSIRIGLPRKFSSEERLRVFVDYVSKPNELKSGGSSAISSDKGLYFINPKGENPHKMPQIWTQGETQSNSAWFPTVDHPGEKMTQEILMTVEDKYTTLSNGIMVASKKNPDGTRTDHWKLDQPHAPYLAMMAVGQFRKVTDEPWNGKEISYYVEKEYEPHAKAIFGDTREMIDFYSKKLGVPYAWPKYAQIAVRDYVSGAMENTSATLHGDFAVYQTTREIIDGKKGTDIIAHELFHQWFGDLVTCESWSHLPLNESFATYGEYLWEEYKNGRDAADQHHLASRAGYMFSQKEVDLIRFDYDHREDMFDGFSYNKGGQVLHMLRKAVGDDAFFASLKNYLETNRYKTAEIHHLRLAFEEVTGKDMNWFFNQWFLNKGRPSLKVKREFVPEKGELHLTVEQVQEAPAVPVYTLPIEVDVFSDEKSERTRIWLKSRVQTFTLSCTSVPRLVNFDAERQLLCDLDYQKTKEELVYQYLHAPLFEDRQEALKGTEKDLADPAVYEIFKQAAEKDKFAPLRNLAILKLENVSEQRLPEIKELYRRIYMTDAKTSTRARALAALNKKFRDDKDIIELNEKAFQEASYAINGVALEALIDRDHKLAMEKAKQLENESGKDIIFPIAGLYADHGYDDQIQFFANTIRYMNGFELMTFMNDYAKVAKRCAKGESVLIAAADLEWVARDGGRFTRFGSLKSIRDLQNIWTEKEKKMLARIEADRKEEKNVAALEKDLKEITETKEALTKCYERAK